MLYERPLSLSASAISVAIIVPDIARYPHSLPGTSLLVAAAIGSLGIVLGCAVTCSEQSGKIKNIQLMTWSLMTIFMSISLGLLAFLIQERGHRVLFLVAAALPVIAFLAIMVPDWRESRKN